MCLCWVWKTRDKNRVPLQCVLLYTGSAQTLFFYAMLQSNQQSGVRVFGVQQKRPHGKGLAVVAFQNNGTP